MTQAEAKRVTLFQHGVNVRREYGLTEAELYEIARNGQVSHATRVWADALRAKNPEAFNVR